VTYEEYPEIVLEFLRRHIEEALQGPLPALHESQMKETLQKVAAAQFRLKQNQTK